jgi:hypothetical protein
LTPSISTGIGVNHNPATPPPNSRPNRGHHWTRDKNHTTAIKGMGMTEQQDRIAREREEIAARVASFKATQQKFERERDEYFVTTLKNARHGSPAFHRPPLWT